MNATEMRVVQLKERNNTSRERTNIEGCISAALQWKTKLQQQQNPTKTLRERKW